MKILSLLTEQILTFAATQYAFRQPVFMKDWEEKIDILLENNGRGILRDNGSVSRNYMKSHVREEYRKYNDKQITFSDGGFMLDE